MKLCPQCNYENQDAAKYCENCGALLKAEEAQTYETETETSAAGAEFLGNEAASRVETTESRYENQHSPLSIVAFICAFILVIVPLVLGVIDLCIGDGRRKGFSVAAVVISVLKLAVIVFALIVPLIFLMR